MLYFQSISILYHLPLIHVGGPYEAHPVTRINLPNPFKKRSRVIALYLLFSYQGDQAILISLGWSRRKILNTASYHIHAKYVYNSSQSENS